MSQSPLNLAVIIGSIRQGRSGHLVASWVSEEATKHDQFNVDVIDLAENPPPLALTNEPPAELAETTRKLDAADAFVVVTPEYNHSYPPGIKALIDWHYTEWRAKPVGFVSYGGAACGLRAVEALRLVFAEMHAVTIRDCVSFGMYSGGLGEDGRPTDEEGSNTAAKAMLDQLAWWASALKTARTESPYQVAF
ncbi:NAD(P)H-dependent oxidoreductase [Actinoplanes sp. NBRC 103695]|uniref:NADPH-dependent FMN reductase n=1 Tax=Actinoplanes sp. NBRC 103695 TaxID=3032202 RepID=UPI0024A2312F|nr:NAD(P)H-dependent oxidoreductase [Actinoplanes sp. NBRC 103695]GLZ00711.1 putative reductase [Actinoplanes sp. NBRC 103695]